MAVIGLPPLDLAYKPITLFQDGGVAPCGAWPGGGVAQCPTCLARAKPGLDRWQLKYKQIKICFLYLGVLVWTANV